MEAWQRCGRPTPWLALQQQKVENASGQGKTMAFQKVFTQVRLTLSCEIIILSKGLDFLTDTNFVSL